MNIESYLVNDIKIAEVSSNKVIIHDIESGLNVLGDAYYLGYNAVIIDEQFITPNFFELKNGMAGEILQKFSNYRVRLAIVGDFSKYSSKSLAAFIFESNKGKHINFLATKKEALKILSTT